MFLKCNLMRWTINDNNDKLDEYASETHKKFLNILAPGLGDSLKGLMICNIINECLRGHHTPGPHPNTDCFWDIIAR